MYNKVFTCIVMISLTTFFARYAILHYRKGQVVVHGEDQPSGIFYIKTGFVKMYSVTESGKEITLNIFKTGSCFPVIWGLTDIPNTYYYQTISDCEIRKSSKLEFVSFVKQKPGALFELTKEVLIGAKALLINIEYGLLGDSHTRVLAILLLCARRFGIKKGQDKVKIDLPLTHEDISNLVGITRETASLTMKQLSKSGLIKNKNKSVIINDIEKLEEESSVFFEEEEESDPPSM